MTAMPDPGEAAAEPTVVLSAALRPVWAGSSASAFWAASMEPLRRLSAAGSLKVALLRDEDRSVHFRRDRAWLQS